MMLGTELEALGHDREAADCYFRALRLRPTLQRLRAYCRFRSPDHVAHIDEYERTGAIFDWALAPALRSWLYCRLESELADAAGSDDLPALEVLRTGCRLTLDRTIDWTLDADQSVVETLVHLMVRGGYCDCEVLLNVATDDDEDFARVFVAGSLEIEADGDWKTCVDEPLPLSFDSSFHVALPDAKAKAGHDGAIDGAVDGDDEDGAPLLVADPHDDHLTFRPQCVRHSALGELLQWLHRMTEQDTVSRLDLQLVATYPDSLERGHAYAYRFDDESTGDFRALPDGPAADGASPIGALWPPLCEAATKPKPETIPIALDALRAPANPSTLVVQCPEHYERMDLIAGTRTPLIARNDAAAFTLGSDGTLAVWLQPFRRRLYDLMALDLVTHERRWLGRSTFSPSDKISARRADEILLSDGRGVFRYSLHSPSQRLADGTNATPSPDGRHIAIAHRGTITLVASPTGAVAHRLAGHGATWSSSGGRLAFLRQTGPTAKHAQVIVFDLSTRAEWALSPPDTESAWPQFCQDDACLVHYLASGQRRTAAEGGGVWLENDEFIMVAEVETGRAQAIWHVPGPPLSISCPLVHPTEPFVVVSLGLRQPQLTRIDFQGGSQPLATGRVRPLSWMGPPSS